MSVCTRNLKRTSILFCITCMIALPSIGISAERKSHGKSSGKKVVDAKLVPKTDQKVPSDISTVKESQSDQRERLQQVSLVDWTISQPDWQPPEDEWSDYVPPPPAPLSYFDADDDGTSIFNQAILAYLSMAVYSDFPDEEDFQEELDNRLLPIGAVLVDAFVGDHGTEGAIIVLDDATIVAFRGTSSNGTHLPDADYFIDTDIYPTEIEVDGTTMHAHDGFWSNADRVHNLIYPLVSESFQAGHRIWVTGHSLGGALATATAMRLHYDENITVQGLHTFGSPRVGNDEFSDKFRSGNAHGVNLWDNTRRWVMDGDPAPTFFHGAWTGLQFVSEYVEFAHAGITNTIYPLANGGFEIKEDTGENPRMKWDFSGLAADGSGEHLWYHTALGNELQLQLLSQGELGLAEQFWHALKL